MNAYNSIPRYSLREDFANSIIHGAGFILSIIGMCVLIGFASIYGNAWYVFLRSKKTPSKGPESRAPLKIAGY